MYSNGFTFATEQNNFLHYDFYNRKNKRQLLENIHQPSTRKCF